MLRNFKRLYPYMWRYRWALLLGSLCLMLTNFLEIRVLVLVGSGIDLLKFDAGKAVDLQKALLNYFVLLVLGISLGFGVCRFWMRRLIIDASRHVEYDFRNDFFAKLLRLPTAFYDRYRTGDLMSRATSDIDAMRVVIGPAVMYLANTVTILPLTIFEMIHLSPSLALFCWMPMLLIVPVFYFFSHRIHRRSRRTQEIMSDLSANIQENLSGVRVIKAFAREAQQTEGFTDISRKYIDENMKLARLQSFFFPSLSFLVGLTLLMLLLRGSILIIQDRLTLGGLISFFLLLMTSIWPLAALGWVLAQLERGAASMKRLDEIFNQPVVIHDHETTVDQPPKFEGHIQINDLEFLYPGSVIPALKGVNLDLPAGSTLGLTGPVGCGKSTLAALMARRYNPPRGTIFMDGIDLLDWPVETLRGQIGIVDQEPFLFSDTIGANIIFGLAGNDPRDREAVIRDAARISQIDHDVEALPTGYNTILGERGINLSGGQRQRTALARALARDPRLLILDDALAAVDTQTEEAILRGLREVLGRRTTVLISHRVSTVSLADIIVYLENGEIVEQGTHDELLGQRGKYWTMAQRQKLAEEIEHTA